MPNLRDPGFSFLPNCSAHKWVMVLSSPQFVGNTQSFISRHQSLEGVSNLRIDDIASFEIYWYFFLAQFMFCCYRWTFNVRVWKKIFFWGGWEWCSALSWLVMLVFSILCGFLLSYQLRRWNLHGCLSVFSPFGFSILCVRSLVLSSGASIYMGLFIFLMHCSLSWLYLL